MYCVITADINNSSGAANRGELQEIIHRAIKKVNKEFKEPLIVPFSVTIGDEWQGMLNDLSNSYRIIDRFRELLFDYKASYGIGMGPIQTAVLKRTSNMDGEAFHYSRQALNRAKSEKKEIIYLTRDDLVDIPVNAICMLLEVLRSRWTSRQTEKIMLYKKLKSETRVAQKLGVTQGDINQAIKAGAGKRYLEAEEQLATFLAMSAK